MGRALALATVFAAATVSASAQSRVDKNVVYGMYSGAAMLLDVHYPAKPNGLGIIFIAADRTIPFHQSELMEAALKKVNVPVKLIRIEGADHGPDFPGARNPPDYKAEMVKWFDTCLRKSTGSR